MTSPAEPDRVPLLWEAMSEGDARAGRALVADQLDRGVPGADLIVDLLAPAQRGVGVRWQQREWSVADEHAATAVVDAALASIESGSALAGSGPALVVACAESEWHTLPARMAAQLLREAGANVRFLGPSMPADHLREYLARLQPDALVLSATIPTSLPGAARSVEAAHDVAVPVLAGGAAFGVDDVRATRIGADAWLASAQDVDPTAIPTRAGAGADLDWPAFLALEAAGPDAAAAAFHGLLVRVPSLQAMSPVHVARTREDLQHVLDFLAVAVLVGDQRVMDDFTGWLLQVLGARGIPRSAVEAAYLALAEELPAQAGAVLESALRPGAAA